MKFLFLHGWGTTHKSMEPIIEKLECTDYLNPDLPGFGDEKEPSEAWYSSDYANWISELCRKNKFSLDVIVGHSNGGKIALRLVSTGLIKPKYLVLIAPSFVRHEVQWWKRLAVSILKPFKFLSKIHIFRRIFFKAIGSPDYHKLVSNVMKQTFRNVVSEDLRGELINIKVPTLIFWGTKDTYTPFSDAKILNEGIKGSKLVTFKGEGHFIHKTRAKEIAEATKKLTNLPRSAGLIYK